MGLVSKGDVVMVMGFEISIRCVAAKQRWNQDTLLPQVSHEELQTNQSEYTEAEHRQDHDVRQLLHCLNESSDNRLQT